MLFLRSYRVIPMEKLSVATYAARHIINDSPKGMEEFADFLVEQKVPFVEINNMFTKPEKLQETVRIFTDRGITPNQLTIDGNNFFQKSEKARKKQFDFMKKWIDAAHESSIPMVRANMGHDLGLIRKTGTVENLVATFKPIMDYTERLGISFVFENHGGKSSDINFQLAVKKAFDTPKMGYLLDTGNYNPKDLIYENILKLKDSILVVHAKTYAFDETGEETKLDFKKIIENLKTINFDGIYSVEFEGNLPDFEGIKKTLNLLRKYV